jgi:hypothetical protein
VGAPLDTAVIFIFDSSKSLPQGPFNQSTLPVFTTPAEVTPEAFPPDGTSPILAKGTYVPVGFTVEFRPFVPTGVLTSNLSGNPDSIPGLLPASTYTVRVTTTPGLAIPNLVGNGGEVKFGTTSNPSIYFSSGQGDGLPPAIVSTSPVEGASNIYPGLYSNVPLGSTLETFSPKGPETFSIVYDRGVLPDQDNLMGLDWDGDGLKEAPFFLRMRGTRLLVGHTVPAGAFQAGEPAFTAISGLTESASSPELVVDPGGGTVFLHNSQFAGGLPNATTALPATPKGMSLGVDGSLLYAVFDGPGDDTLGVIDHVLGDPSHARMAVSTVPLPGLSDFVGLVSLQDGRLVGFDRGQRRIVEIVPTVTRVRPAGTPVMSGVVVGDGVLAGVFRSAAFPAGVQDVLDLAQLPSGRLLALAEIGSSHPVILELNPIDFDLNDSFDAADGLSDGSSVVVAPVKSYTAIDVLDEVQVLALDREGDAVDRVLLTSGEAVRVVSDLAGYDTLGAGEDSPATTMALGALNLDLEIALVDNIPTRSEFRLAPRAILPPATPFHVMQRPNLASLSGVSETNADPDVPAYALGARAILGLSTAAPFQTIGECGIPDADGRMHDVLDEQFTDKSMEDSSPTSLSPVAEWAAQVAGGSTSGTLRASTGATTGIPLGDFRPQANANYNSLKGHSFAPDDVNAAGYKIIFLDTDAQHFPLPDGSTPGISTSITVFGGHFNFHDVIIPDGIWIIAKGSHPLRITATGRVEISGLLDVSGSDGTDDDTFDTGWIPVPGGQGGAGAGRGGDSQPTLWDPKYQALVPLNNGAQQAAQYVTPEAAENGFGPVILPTGGVTFAPIGGRGGVSTLGYDPNPAFFTKIANGGHNTEYHRGPGGAGGSFYFHGMRAHVGSGAFRVQSNSTWSPFTRCPVQDWRSDMVYGNEELRWQGLTPNHFLQCVYIQGSILAPTYFQPSGPPGDLLFKDGDPSNDYIGPGGELEVLIGGQGGGGGSTRIDSFNAGIWSANRLAVPAAFPPVAPPYYPALAFNNVYWSPMLYDAKGGGGGGGGGSVQIIAFQDIVVTRTGRIDASGGDGKGGEIIGNSNYSGGGGGGSGGAIILQAAGVIRVEADADHDTPFYADITGAQGASLDVSGGFGCDAETSPDDTIASPVADNEFTRSDGGQGGFGMIQLQEGSGDGIPEVQQGAFLFANIRAVMKQGDWNGFTKFQQAESAEWNNPNNAPVDILRYIDILEYRRTVFENGQPLVAAVTVNGSYPPLIIPKAGTTPSTWQLDSTMIDHFGRKVVREPFPQLFLATYSGYDPVTFKEAGMAGTPTPPAGPPGTLYASTDDIPLRIYLKEPDGTSLKVDPLDPDPFAEVDPEQVIDRLPVVHPSVLPPAIGFISRGTSRWLDFNGVALRARDAAGLTPPHFSGLYGTYNAFTGSIPPGKDGQVIVANPVPSVPGDTPAHFVANTGLIPVFDPGLCANQGAGGPPQNDIKVDAPEYGIENAITDNASVSVQFQGAFPVRAGSHIPDPDSLTAWVTDLRDVSGYPLVRFRVTFDLAKDPAYPFGPTSKRPGVDRLRIRAEY